MRTPICAIASRRLIVSFKISPAGFLPSVYNLFGNRKRASKVDRNIAKNCHGAPQRQRATDRIKPNKNA
jgi:hypothetical protein